MKVIPTLIAGAILSVATTTSVFAAPAVVLKTLSVGQEQVARLIRFL